MADKWNEQLRRKMADYQSAPPDGLWESLEAGLARKRAAAFPWRWALTGGGIAAAVAAVAALLLVAAVIVEKRCNLATWQLLLVFLVPYLVAGFDTLKEAAEGLSHGEALDENFLMSIATIGALCIGFLPEAEPQFR